MKITILCSDYFQNDLVSAVEVFLDYQEILQGSECNISLERWGVHPETIGRFYRPLIMIENIKQKGYIIEKEWAEKDDLYELVGQYALDYFDGLIDESLTTNQENV